MAVSWSGVRSTAWPTLRESASTSTVRTSDVAPSSTTSGWAFDRTRWRRAPDHPELEGEELVEGQPAEGGVERLGIVRVVGTLDRPTDPFERLGSAQVGRQVLGVGQPGPIDRLAHRHAQSRRGDARRQAVDRDDPPGVEQVALTVLALELRVVEDRRRSRAS